MDTSNSSAMPTSQSKSISLKPVNQHSMHTHTCGELRAENIGEVVTLTGWVWRRRDFGGLVFVDLRDREGLTQVLFDPDVAPEAFKTAESIRPEWPVCITGTVQHRSEGQTNESLATGEVEILASEIEVLNTAQTPPFQIENHIDVNEDLRLRYRYVDLRRPRMARNLRLRSDFTFALREAFHKRDFTEVETPALFKSTPEGARDFLVPSRMQGGSFYALPQSPQLLKQLLMIGGVERYYQVAKCFRDEDLRADRQPEFTQVDVEMSFVEQDDVIAVAEDVLREVWALIDYELPTPIARMTYHDAMERYGSDKPDLRFGCELVDLTDYFKDTTFRVFQNPYVGAVVMPGGASQSRRTFDAWQEWAKQRGAKGLAYVTVAEDGTLGGPVAKNITDAEREGLAQAAGAAPGDCIFFAAGPVDSSRALLGAARLEIGKRCGLIDDDEWSFVWVVDAPLFKPSAEAKADGDVALGKSAWTAVHHAFTSPKPECLDTFDTDPGSALAYAYDIVCNGNEIGGGSIRIHRSDVQERVFNVMGIGEQEAQEKFGFLLDAFKFGAPPHGGIAFGWDRIVSLLTRADSIRDVIAFPKSGGGFDPLTEAPAPITPEQRKEAGVDAEPDTADKPEGANKA